MELANTASVGTLLFGIVVGSVPTWAFARWYYLKDGRAKLKEKEDEIKALRDQYRA